MANILFLQTKYKTTPTVLGGRCVGWNTAPAVISIAQHIHPAGLGGCWQADKLQLNVAIIANTRMYMY